MAMALTPPAAAEEDTLTISGLFGMDDLGGTVGPDLAEVYANGHEHSWTLTLHGISQSYYYWDGLTTQIHATSLNLEFSGPDAATLNGIVSEHLGGGEVSADLTNFYWDDLGNFASIRVLVWSPEVVFHAGGFEQRSETLFPSDEYGYPAVGPEPFSIWTEASHLDDSRPGNYGYVASWENVVTIRLVPSLPQLTITRSNNGVVVSWPSSSSGFSLQENRQLHTSNWVTPGETVTDNGTIKFITVDHPTGSRFYRLFKP